MSEGDAPLRTKVLSFDTVQKRLSFAALVAVAAIAWWFLVASEQAMRSMRGDGLLQPPQSVGGEAYDALRSEARRVACPSTSPRRRATTTPSRTPTHPPSSAPHLLSSSLRRLAGLRGGAPAALARGRRRERRRRTRARRLEGRRAAAVPAAQQAAGGVDGARAQRHLRRPGCGGRQPSTHRAPVSVRAGLAARGASIAAAQKQRPS